MTSLGTKHHLPIPSEYAMRRAIRAINGPKPQPPALRAANVKRSERKSQPLVETPTAANNGPNAILESIGKDVDARAIRDTEHIDAARLRVIRRLEAMAAEIKDEDPRKCEECGGYDTRAQRSEILATLREMLTILRDMDRALGRGNSMQVNVTIESQRQHQVMDVIAKHVPQERWPEVAAELERIWPEAKR